MTSEKNDVVEEVKEGKYHTSEQTLDDIKQIKAVRLTPISQTNKHLTINSLDDLKAFILFIIAV